MSERAPASGGPMLLACCVIAFLIVAALLAWVLVDHDYEAEYLALGTLLVRGDITLYQDEMTGQWMPLPFYFFGLSQAIFGPSLLVARLLAVLLGALVVVLIFALAARWGGRLAGVAACGLFCSHGLVMGYFATAHFEIYVVHGARFGAAPEIFENFGQAANGDDCFRVRRNYVGTLLCCECCFHGQRLV